MKIAQIAPPWFAVPPTGYGGIELVVAILADGLAERGHDVTLFASGGSRTKATLVSPLVDPPDPALLGNVQTHQGALPSAGGEGKSSLPVPRRSSRRPERESERRIPARQLQQRGNTTAPSRSPAAA